MSVAKVYSDEHDYAKEDQYLNKTKMHIDGLRDSTLLCACVDGKDIGFNQRKRQKLQFHSGYRIR